MAIREALLLAMRDDWVPFMCTLSINPEWFDNPYEALRFGQSNMSKFIQKLKRLGVLRSSRYFAPWEPQKNGWPHWHVLVDSRYISKADLQEAWDSLGRNAGYEGAGFTYFTAKKHYQTVETAANYATKYVTKPPEGGWPEWVKKCDSILRRYSAAQGLRLRAAIDGVAKERKVVAAGEKASVVGAGVVEPVERCTKTYEERTRRCGNKTIIREVFVYMRPGGELVENGRYTACLFDDADRIAEAFGIYLGGGGVAVLPVTDAEQFRDQCDSRRKVETEREAARRRREVEALRVPGQQTMMEFEPVVVVTINDLGVEVL